MNIKTRKGGHITPGLNDNRPAKAQGLTAVARLRRPMFRSRQWKNDKRITKRIVRVKSRPIAQNQEPEVVEAVRLINKFFPESKGFVSPEMGIGIWSFVEAMKLADFGADYSCDPFGMPDGPDLGLASKGGFMDDDQTVFARLLVHAGFSPSGRCVIIPDALGRGWSAENLQPIVCDHKMAAQRIEKLGCLFDETHDSVFVFESGEAMAVDHDNRFFWAKSRRNFLKKVKQVLKK